ncbi:MAG: hypothetical protein ACI9DC_000731 [Gammaproteobacteria bacterium]|jgi:hypothetical protein
MGQLALEVVEKSGNREEEWEQRDEDLPEMRDMKLSPRRCGLCQHHVCF